MIVNCIYRLIVFCSLLFYSGVTYAQTTMEVEGSIKIGDSNALAPDLGTMRWTGSDFQVWNGVNWASLTGNKEVGTVTDIDNNTYKTIRIGDQIWMAENLRVTKYNDNIPMDQITNNATWGGLSTGAWCWYNNDNSNEDPYGKLYNWYAVETGKLCPTGWHVHTDTEWTTLTDYLGGKADGGGKLKEMGTDHWNSPNTAATNESGFTGLPGGKREGPFSLIGNNGYWWSSKEDIESAKHHQLYHDADNVKGLIGPKGFGYSVRCLKD